MITLRNNERLMAEIDRIAEVAGYLWTKGWAERNGGNNNEDATFNEIADYTMMDNETIYASLIAEN